MNIHPLILTSVMVTGVLMFLALIVWLSVRFEKQRTAALQAAGAALGFEVLTVFPPEFDGLVAGSALMNTGRQRVSSNILRRQVDPLDVVLYDYRYTTGSGKSSHTHQQTVALFHSPRLRVPHFVLKPEGWVSRLGEFFGAQDIDFADVPEFSRKFVLSGKDERAIRDFLTRDRLQTLSEMDKLCLEAQPGSLLVWFDHRRVPPEELQTFFQQAFSAYTALLSDQPA